MRIAHLPLLGLIFGLGMAPTVAAAQSAPAPATATAPAAAPRERIDGDWRFALGHATDPSRDLGYGTAAFFFAKAGYGDGPANVKFDDRAWRRLDLPHDWGVEVPISAKAEGNHGSRGCCQTNPNPSLPDTF